MTRKWDSSGSNSIDFLQYKNPNDSDHFISNCVSASCTTFELSLASMIRQAALVPRSTAKDGSVSVFFFMMSKEKRVLSTISRFIHINFTITSRSYP